MQWASVEVCKLDDFVPRILSRGRRNRCFSSFPSVHSYGTTRSNSHIQSASNHSREYDTVTRIINYNILYFTVFAATAFVINYQRFFCMQVTFVVVCTCIINSITILPISPQLVIWISQTIDVFL